MKNWIQILILTIILFIFFTLVTMKIETPFDGNDAYGFPFTFHIKWSGMCNKCPENETETNYLYFIIDFIIVGFISFGIWNFYQKIKPQIK
jgi:hypothetical protein